MTVWATRVTVVLVLVALGAGAASAQAPQRGLVPPVAPRAAPVAPPAPAPAVVLPDPPIPVQHLMRAGIPACEAGVNAASRKSLITAYNAQSQWNILDPSHHVFQSVAGVKNARNNPASGMVAIIAAPILDGKCDTVAVEVFPLAKSCADVQRLIAKGGEVETGLEDIRVLIGDDKHRVFLMPAAGNTCVAVTVDTTFAP